jgi:hypothetical protein
LTQALDDIIGRVDNIVADDVEVKDIFKEEGL